jgi:hypothetical protein
MAVKGSARQDAAFLKGAQVAEVVVMPVGDKNDVDVGGLQAHVLERVDEVFLIPFDVVCAAVALVVEAGVDEDLRVRLYVRDRRAAAGPRKALHGHDVHLGLLERLPAYRALFYDLNGFHWHNDQ